MYSIPAQMVKSVPTPNAPNSVVFTTAADDVPEPLAGTLPIALGVRK